MAFWGFGNFVISGSPINPLFLTLNIPNYLNELTKNPKSVVRNIIWEMFLDKKKQLEEEAALR